jgi:hypothetical protein
MKRLIHHSLFASILLVCLLFVNSGLATQSVELEMTEFNDSKVEIPQLTGMDNSFVENTINEAIKAAAADHLNTLSLLQSGTPGQLTVKGKYTVIPSRDGHDLLSILLTAQGRMPTGRPGHQQIPLSFDLANGQSVTAEQIFKDTAAAQTWFEVKVAEIFEETLSNYLDIEDLKPFPLERFLIDETGITFYYPDNTLTWLSGQTASIHFLYHEILDQLKLEEQSFLGNLGVLERLKPDEQSQARIKDIVKDGRLPGFDIRLGEKMLDIQEQFGLLYDPEGFAEGESVQLEDDRYRETLLIAYGDGLLDGILSKRMNLLGLITGLSTQDDVQSVLGEPFTSLDMTDTAAALYKLPVGVMDVYPVEGVELRMYYQEDRVLYAVWIQTIK